MHKISDIVREVLFEDPLALDALRAGWLNLSAYANSIHPIVEEKSWKAVKKTTIVVALSRIAADLEEVPSLAPNIVLDELSIKSPLCDITFEKTKKNIVAARKLAEVVKTSETAFLTVTEGVSEITVIASQDLQAAIIAHFGEQPRAIFADVVGISVTFSDEYIPQPNVIFAIISRLASKRINLIEIVSTYTELTMIVEKQEMDLAIQALKVFFKVRKIT